MKIKKEPTICESRKSQECAKVFNDGDNIFIFLRKGTQNGIACCYECIKQEAIAGFAANLIRGIF